jgi:CRP-like cAMP-binding protein
MIGVFNVYPWIMPAESEDLRAFFRERGIKKTFAKRQILPHGGKDGTIGMVESGLISFFFYDAQARQQVFSLSAAGCLLGDIEALDGTKSYAMAECLTETEMLIVPRTAFTDYLKSDILRMEEYARSANRKHQCAMEGMISTYIYPVEDRLLLFLYSLVHAFKEERVGEFLRLPLQLSVTDIARVLSADRSWVSLTLNSWAKSGLVKKSGRAILIHPDLFSHKTISGQFTEANWSS